jgi:ribosomal protein L13
VVFTGNKQEQKLYDTYSGYPGGRGKAADSLLKRRPEVVIERAVKGMLPKIASAGRCIKNYSFIPVLNILTRHNNQKN